MTAKQQDTIVPYPLNQKVLDTYDRLLRRILYRQETFERVESGLIAFETRLRVAEHSSAPGAHKARKLLTTAGRLLAQAKSDPLAAFVPHVLAAIDYLIKETDEIPDFSNANSFRDDQQVLEAVMGHFGLNETL